MRKIFVKLDSSISLAYFFRDRLKEKVNNSENITVLGKEDHKYWIVSTDFHFIDDLEKVFHIIYEEDFETCFDYLEESPPHFWWVMPVNSFEEFQEKFKKNSIDQKIVEI